MTSLTIRPLNTGFVTTVPAQYLFHHSVHPYVEGATHDRVEIPDFAFLVEGGEELVLVDTGMSWTERASTYHHPGSHQPPGMAIHERLAALGIRCEDIGVIAITHLHWDHSYYLEKFTNATIYVHERELAFAENPIPMYYKSYENEAIGITPHFAGVDFTTVAGGRELIPGVRVFETHGHSPGHLSVEVDTAAGNFVCSGDSIFCPENLEPIPELGYDITPPGRYVDAIGMWNSIVAQRDRVADPSFILGAHDRPLLDRIRETPVLGLV
ncbi:N-acyl homoserine lactonase family protein [Agromyces laixinhei]|uniref:N-acyl homoserine lactonase family protein n=1 Tax=Agromyces laixinhei TaxID=2585717 RepID=UPI0012EDE3D8|nr:N-acyl homoserine lactonase family protein [Agromyces laixinhei]